MKITDRIVLEKLSQVLDPEIAISIVDLGLIYDVKIKKNKIIVIMTLTTVGCPLFDIIEQDIKDKIKELGFKEKDIQIKLVFDPPWSIDRMSKKGKKLLGI